jgi:hypothetical protein
MKKRELFLNLVNLLEINVMTLACDIKKFQNFRKYFF